MIKVNESTNIKAALESGEKKFSVGKNDVLAYLKELNKDTKITIFVSSSYSAWVEDTDGNRVSGSKTYFPSEIYDYVSKLKTTKFVVSKFKNLVSIEFKVKEKDEDGSSTTLHKELRIG